MALKSYIFGDTPHAHSEEANLYSRANFGVQADYNLFRNAVVPTNIWIDNVYTLLHGYKRSTDLYNPSLYGGVFDSLRLASNGLYKGAKITPGAFQFSRDTAIEFTTGQLIGIDTSHLYTPDNSAFVSYAIGIVSEDDKQPIFGPNIYIPAETSTSGWAEHHPLCGELFNAAGGNDLSTTDLGTLMPAAGNITKCVLRLDRALHLNDNIQVSILENGNLIKVYWFEGTGSQIVFTDSSTVAIKAGKHYALNVSIFRSANGPSVTTTASSYLWAYLSFEFTPTAANTWVIANNGYFPEESSDNITGLVDNLYQYPINHSVNYHTRNNEVPGGIVWLIRQHNGALTISERADAPSVPGKVVSMYVKQSDSLSTKCNHKLFQGSTEKYSLSILGTTTGNATGLSLLLSPGNRLRLALEKTRLVGSIFQKLKWLGVSLAIENIINRQTITSGFTLLDRTFRTITSQFTLKLTTQKTITSQFTVGAAPQFITSQFTIKSTTYKTITSSFTIIPSYNGGEGYARAWKILT